MKPAGSRGGHGGPGGGGRSSCGDGHQPPPRPKGLQASGKGVGAGEVGVRTALRPGRARAHARPCRALPGLSAHTALPTHLPALPTTLLVLRASSAPSSTRIGVGAGASHFSCGFLTPPTHNPATHPAQSLTRATAGNGAQIITRRLRPRSKSELLVSVSVLTFFMSAGEAGGAWWAGWQGGRAASNRLNPWDVKPRGSSP